MSSTINKLYYVAKNGLCGIKECEVERETDKSYIMKQLFQFSYVRKSGMDMADVVFFTSKAAAVLYYENIQTMRRKFINAFCKDLKQSKR